MNLTAKRIERLKEPGMYLDGFVPGFYFQIGKQGGRSFILRYTSPTKRTERYMGLGPVSVLTLADARERARRARQQILDGVDPIDARRGLKQALAVEATRSKTFKECGDEYIKSNRKNWKSAKHASQWEATLKTYAYPILGNLAVSSIGTTLIINVLEQETDDGPLWTSKQETASRLRGRIETILSWATVRGFRSGENPARWHGHLREALTRTVPHKHHPALPFNEMPAFMRDLKARDREISAKALEFLILTATRTSEVIGARWDEIDDKEKIWTIPGVRMKSGREHRVPLSPQAVALLKKIPREGEFIFMGAREGRHLSNMAMLQLMKAMRPGYVVHGFRSSFRTWAAERGFPRDIAESALAHVLKDKTEAAYQRGDLLERRRAMMSAWALHCLAPEKGATVTPISKARRVAG